MVTMRRVAPEILIDYHFNELRGESAAREIARWEGFAIKFLELICI